MVNVKVKPGREEIVIGRFWLHIILTIILLYPFFARVIAQIIGVSIAGAMEVFSRIMVFGSGQFFLNYPSLSGLLCGLLSIWAVALGALSMEIHSVPRKLVTFPLFLVNLLTALTYFASAL